MTPAFLHGSYLVNIAGAPDLLRKSIDSLTNHMGAASQLGAVGVIFHCGSHKGAGFEAVRDSAAAALSEVLANTPEDAYLILENSAGMGAQLGASFEEIAWLMGRRWQPAPQSLPGHRTRLRSRLRPRRPRNDRRRDG